MRHIRPFYSYDSQDAEFLASALNKIKGTEPEHYAEAVGIIRDYNYLATGRAPWKRFRDRQHKAEIDKHLGAGEEYAFISSDDELFASDPEKIPELVALRLTAHLDKYRYRAEVIEWHNGNVTTEMKSASPGSARIYKVMRLAECGLLVRVRQCERCGDWFYAKRDRARFCKKMCARLHWQTSETGKAKRKKYLREYMRDYRQGKLRTREGE
jgi:hypothetical protein